MYSILGNKFKRHYLKKKTFFLDFYCISGMCMKFETFWKKYEYPSLIISEIIDCKRGGYLSV